jgi:haloacetate dehalogenase
MIEGFEAQRIDTGETEIYVETGGSGPPILLLHGYPQTLAMWRRIAPALAGRHSVVAADLRGYGRSGKPGGDDMHLTYSKRAMARDMAAVMDRLGHATYRVIGHDRGGRVAHRLAMDHPERVTQLVLMDILPTLAVFEHLTQKSATQYYHWFFLIQPNGLPEHLIGQDPEFFLKRKLGSWGADFTLFEPEAVADYLACFSDPATIHASCEDYRAAASIDLVHDRTDRNAGRRLACPLLVLWGKQGNLGGEDVLRHWRERAADVRGQAMDCGHFLAEEAPRKTLEQIQAFIDAPADLSA